MKPFLYLDNWHEPQPPTAFDNFLHTLNLKIDLRRTNDGDFPENTNYCGAYVSPSFDGAYDDIGWIEEEHSVLQRLARSNVPMLGLCFGSQILASALVGRDQVFIRESRECGFGEITLTRHARADPLAQRLPVSVPVFHWHGDEVGAENPDIIVLAESPACGNQFWRWSKGPVWGVQPHPEFDGPGLVSWYENNRSVFDLQKFGVSDMISETHDTEPAFGILKNFMAFAISNQSNRG